MKTRKIKKQGISLIVLVITIIVMIILASSIILTLNDSGIIQKANEAVEVTDLAQVKNMAALIWSEAYLNNEPDLKSAVLEGLKQERIDTSKYYITVTGDGVDVTLRVQVPEEWQQNVTAIIDGVPIPNGFVASPYAGENTKNGGLVIYELNEGETSLPSSETKYISWTTRNQYVWVPVSRDEFTTKFVKQNFGLNASISNTAGEANKYWEVALDLTTNMPLPEQDEYLITTSTLPGGVTNTLAEVQAMYASVKEYEGFYVARYEAGIDTQRVENDNVLETNVYSMMGKIPYTYVPWTKNFSLGEDTNGAVQVARSIYPVTDTTSNHGVVSTLMYNVQWDATLQWWLDTKAVSSVTNSTEYGNYIDHIITSTSDLNEGAKVLDDGSYVSKESDTLTYPKASGTEWALSTGALKVAKVNNIYDMAGNVYEWTMGGCDFGTRTNRGGYFASSGTSGNNPVAKYTDNTPSNASVSLGFRMALYIKQ